MCQLFSTKWDSKKTELGKTVLHKAIDNTFTEFWEKSIIVLIHMHQLTLVTLIETQCNVKGIRRSKQVINFSQGNKLPIRNDDTFDTGQNKWYHGSSKGKRGRTQVILSGKLNLAHMWDSCREKVNAELRHLLRDRRGELGGSRQRFQPLHQKQGRTFEKQWSSALWPHSDSLNLTSGVEKRGAKRQERELESSLISLQCGHEWLQCSPFWWTMALKFQSVYNPNLQF